MTIQLADVTIHIDEALDKTKMEQLRDRLLGQAGVVTADYKMEKPHLMIVEYDPAKNNSAGLLRSLATEGVHAELIGL